MNASADRRQPQRDDGRVRFSFPAASMIGGLVLLVFLFLDGTPGSNRFGLDPKGRAGAGDVFA